MFGKGLAAAAAMSAMALTVGNDYHQRDLRYRPNEPRKKSTHVRKHKGSKAAKKANRKPKPTTFQLKRSARKPR